MSTSMSPRAKAPKEMPNEYEFTLISEDGIKFQVTMHLVRCIGLFKNLLELKLNSALSISGNEDQNSILKVPNVNSLILDKIIEYLNNYVASKENSSLTKPMNSNSSAKTKTSSLSVKSIISGIQNSNKSSIDDDDDEDDCLNCNLTKEEEQEKEGDDIEIDEFEMISYEEEEENVFDFANFDEQSLKLFTPYEQNFFGSLDIPTLIEITKAANYMHIPHLLDSCCKAIANHMKGLSVEELRSKFNIKNDFTPEEEERVRRETSWIDE